MEQSQSFNKKKNHCLLISIFIFKCYFFSLVNGWNLLEWPLLIAAFVLGPTSCLMFTFRRQLVQLQSIFIYQGENTYEVVELNQMSISSIFAITLIIGALVFAILKNGKLSVYLQCVVMAFWRICTYVLLFQHNVWLRASSAHVIVILLARNRLVLQTKKGLSF